MLAQMLSGSISNVAFGTKIANNNSKSNFENFAVGSNNNNEASNDNEETNMAVDPPVYNSSLSKTQKTLFVRWQECEVGIAGDKSKQGVLQGQRGGGQNSFCIDARLSGILRQILLELGSNTAHVTINQILY
jgi:hypothetical protein